MQELSWEGYLVDIRTAEIIGKNPESAEKQAAAYEKTTALNLGPVSGYGIFVGSEWLKLDAAGNSQAQSVIRDSKKESGIRVIVTGRLYGNTIAVTSIKEVTEETDKPQYN